MGARAGLAGKVDSKSQAAHAPNPALEKTSKKPGLTHGGKPDAG